MHFQERGVVPRRQIGRRARPEKLERWQGARFRDPRQLYRERWRRDCRRSPRADRKDQGDRAGEARNRIGNRSANRGGRSVNKELPKKIAVVMGGPGSERDVSLATARGVSKALRSLGPEVVEVDVRDENFEVPNDVDLAFITIHGTFGEDGQIQRILEQRGIAYTGD